MQQCFAQYLERLKLDISIGNSHGSRGSHGIPMEMGIVKLVSWEWKWEWEWLDGNGRK